MKTRPTKKQPPTKTGGGMVKAVKAWAVVGAHSGHVYEIALIRQRLQPVSKGSHLRIIPVTITPRRPANGKR